MYQLVYKSYVKIGGAGTDKVGTALRTQESAQDGIELVCLDRGPCPTRVSPNRRQLGPQETSGLLENLT